MTTNPDNTLCDDTALGYQRCRTQFGVNAPLLLDASYRLAHLPLVSPEHPDVITRRDSQGYAMGRHGPVTSLVLPVSQEKLDMSPAYRALEAAVRTSCFAHKVAWNIVEKRRGRLHATLCGSLPHGSLPDGSFGQQEKPPLLRSEDQQRLRQLAPVNVELRGLFSGNVNVGRLYLKAYPSTKGGKQAFNEIQRAMSRPLTDLHLVGLFNLIDHLTASEAGALDQLIKDWWDRPILAFEVEELWLLKAYDDLVLDAAVVQNISMKAI